MRIFGNSGYSFKTEKTITVCSPAAFFKIAVVKVLESFWKYLHCESVLSKNVGKACAFKEKETKS